MPVKIRLQRHGKKGKPFYWVVAADARTKRDGRYLEKLGTYNPNTNPATVDINIDQAVKWLENGAQPTDTAKTLLSYRGILLKHHLNGGVRKGAFSEEEAEKRFTAWLEEKHAKIQAKVDGLSKAEATALAERLAAEKEVNEKRIAAQQTAEAPTEAPAADGEEAPAAETAPEAEAPATEEVPAEDTTPEAKVPATEEAPAEDTTPEPEAETAPEAEAPATEEAPAENAAPEAEDTSEDKAEDNTEDKAAE